MRNNIFKIIPDSLDSTRPDGTAVTPTASIVGVERAVGCPDELDREGKGIRPASNFRMSIRPTMHMAETERDSGGDLRLLPLRPYRRTHEAFLGFVS